MDRICERCGAQCLPHEQMYRLRIQMFAEAGPLEFTEEDLLSSTPEAFEDLIKQLEGLDPEEAEAQIHESFAFRLCPKCRREIHKLLMTRAAAQQEKPS